MRRLFVLLGFVLLGSCGDDDGPAFVFEDAATSDAGGDGDGGGRRDSAIAPGDCPAGTEWIYLIDFDGSFIRFQPDTRDLVVQGVLSCPAGDATPYSMAIDRQGIAWVLYNDGNLFRVPLEDLSCAATDFVPGQMGFELFGMGYSANDLGSAEETLFVGGGPELSGGGTYELGTIDAALSLSARGSLSSLPELTGTGNAELWGFFPAESPMVVRQIDKTNGGTIQMFDVGRIAAAGTTQSYAFAYWGGRFYIFHKTIDGTSSAIWQLTTDLGQLEEVVPDTGRRIVGAGVSTCAPVILI